MSRCPANAKKKRLDDTLNLIIAYLEGIGVKLQRVIDLNSWRNFYTLIQYHREVLNLEGGQTHSFDVFLSFVT